MPLVKNIIYNTAKGITYPRIPIPKEYCKTDKVSIAELEDGSLLVRFV
jgi:hypothetical protein